jgi:hypothetical protein
MDQKSNLNQYLIDNKYHITSEKPQIYSLSKREDREQIKKLFETGKVQNVADNYEVQLREYFQVTNPTLVYDPLFEDYFKKYLDEELDKQIIENQGNWVFFPWSSTLVHILPEEAFFEVRTARNKNLITKEEQEIFYNATIGIGGLSVGNSVALAIVLQGGGKKIKLADPDILELSNTNRIRSGVESLGISKVVMTARQIYVINPYAEVEIFPEGLSKDNIDSFFSSTPKLDIIIDELDNLAVKFLIREAAKKNKIAVVMGADNGDNAVIDIERYDLNPQPQFFHSRIGDTNYEQLSQLDKFGIGRTITQHIGPENVTERMQASLLEMGKTIVSWPQLGGAALLNGSAVAYCVRKILNGNPLESNRSIISLDQKLIPEYNSKDEEQKINRDPGKYRS